MDETEIRNTILQKLEEIEQKEHVKILHCIESGSRSWGFASPDSDFDVRFVYVRQREDYLQLQEMRDVIEWEINDVYDICGWDLQKYLRLLHKSNPTCFEWTNSMDVYRTSSEWEQVRALLPEYFLQKPMMYHYLSMAKSNYHKFLSDEKVKLKKYFYVLRALLACQWVANRNLPPPMPFEELIKDELPEKLFPIVRELLERKKHTGELGVQEHIPELDEYIFSEFEELSRKANEANAQPPADWWNLNQVFLHLIP